MIGIEQPVLEGGVERGLCQMDILSNFLFSCKLYITMKKN